jgi:hypothetical protein
MRPMAASSHRLDDKFCQGSVSRASSATSDCRSIMFVSCSFNRRSALPRWSSFISFLDTFFFLHASFSSLMFDVLVRTVHMKLCIQLIATSPPLLSRLAGDSLARNHSSFGLYPLSILVLSSLIIDACCHRDCGRRLRAAFMFNFYFSSPRGFFVDILLIATRLMPSATCPVVGTLVCSFSVCRCSIARRARLERSFRVIEFGWISVQRGSCAAQSHAQLSGSAADTYIIMHTSKRPSCSSNSLMIAQSSSRSIAHASTGAARNCNFARDRLAMDSCCDRRRCGPRAHQMRAGRRGCSGHGASSGVEQNCKSHCAVYADTMKNAR